MILERLQILLSASHRENQRIERAKRLAQSSFPMVWNALDGTVFSGPFKGLHYVKQSVCSSWCPKLLGTYEIELEETIEALIASRPQSIVVIGAAEGFYACGLAMRLPDAQVVAFEADEQGQKLLTELCEANKLEHRVTILGHCGHDELEKTLSELSGGRTGVVCDIEGGEMTLLDPSIHPSLSKCQIIVELHPWTADHPDEVISGRFTASELHHIPSRERQSTDLPQGSGLNLTELQKIACLHEFRPPQMGWLSITPTSW